ncbi:lytic transglycosylase domain-containing protein [Mesorhizobium sp. IMUNJ 23232]|uniref:lytic transglycosylase domain-containing protein n=1 Tax=Mesorhizobium sp. IMUNJ 23232 TaxID=3376064 RepID=UPI0037994931
MQAESAGDVHAVSPKGAMGLLQIMPATWAELRARHGLGDDPFKPRDNILTGAAYLREMLDRFGKKGFLAAYNAGPARYEEYLAKGRPLPRETVAYLRKLAPMVDGTATVPSTSPRPSHRRSAARSLIFAHAGSSRSVDPVYADRKPNAPADTPPTTTSSLVSSLPARDFVTDLTAIEPLPGDPSHDSGTGHRPPGNGLFVQRSSGFVP